MRYVIQLVRWLLRFMDKSSEDRVDAYSAQSAFFIIMGFIPFVMLLLILLQYTPMTKEDVMTLLKVIFPEGFHAYLETLVGSVYTKSTALLSGTVITAVWACSKAMMSSVRCMRGFRIRDRISFLSFREQWPLLLPGRCFPMAFRSISNIPKGCRQSMEV